MPRSLEAAGESGSVEECAIVGVWREEMPVVAGDRFGKDLEGS